MARHKAASCYRGKTLLDIQWQSHNSRWTPLQRNTLDYPKGYETWKALQDPQESPRNSQMQTKSQRGTTLAWNVPRWGAKLMVSNCSLCANFGKTQPKEPMKPTVPPSLPCILAEDRNWSVWILRGTLFTLCVLLQPVPTSYQDGVFEKQCVVVEELTRQSESMGPQHKWSQMLTPNSAAVNSKNLQKSTVSSMSSVRPITQRLTERRREPFRL